MEEVLGYLRENDSRMAPAQKYCVSSCAVPFLPSFEFGAGLLKTRNQWFLMLMDDDQCYISASAPASRGRMEISPPVLSAQLAAPCR